MSGWMRATLRRPWVMPCVVVGAIAASVSVGYAIVDVSPSGGVVRACYTSTGAVRLVSGPASCTRAERYVEWNLRGPVGPRGATGESGPQGPAGAVGPQGLTGETGPQGVAGPAGPQGDTGLAGPQGPAGADGAQGPAGEVGAAGATGPQGPAGLQGPIGPTGATGPAGPTGLAGPRGEAGPAGVDGAPGGDGRLFTVTLVERPTGSSVIPAGFTVSPLSDFGAGDVSFVVNARGLSQIEGAGPSVGALQRFTVSPSSGATRIVTRTFHASGGRPHVTALVLDAADPCPTGYWQFENINLTTSANNMALLAGPSGFTLGAMSTSPMPISTAGSASGAFTKALAVSASRAVRTCLRVDGVDEGDVATRGGVYPVVVGSQSAGCPDGFAQVDGSHFSTAQGPLYANATESALLLGVGATTTSGALQHQSAILPANAVPTFCVGLYPDRGTTRASVRRTMGDGCPASAIHYTVGDLQRGGVAYGQVTSAATYLGWLYDHTTSDGDGGGFLTTLGGTSYVCLDVAAP